MEPTTPHAPPPAGQPLVEFVRTNRATAAYLLLGLAAVLLIGSAWLAYRGFRGARAEAAPETPLATTPDAPKPEITDLKRGDFVVGWVASLTAFLATAAAGVWLLVGIPNPDPDRQRTDVRLLLLALGGAVGVALILAGLLYFYRWSDSLAKWLDKGEQREMRWVVLPLLMVVAGAGLILAAIQPARAEERHRPAVRKTVYWSNFALTVLLLGVGIVVANVLFALKVPNKLDATSTGFYALSDPTKAFLGTLDRPVTAYFIYPDVGDRATNDIRSLLESTEDAARGKFKKKFVSPVANKSEVDGLKAKFPKIDRNALGILLTIGQDEARHAFIPVDALIKDERVGAKTVEAFDGENQLMRELRFLADNEQKPVVYFTQSNGEMSIGGGGGEAALGASAGMLKEFLGKNYYDVRPLTFPAENPTVPADALVVVVAEPATPLGEAAVGALRKYMTTPQPDGRKGKLIVLAGASPGPENKGVARTGLEGLLAEFNVRLGDKFVYTFPIDGGDYRIATSAFTRASEGNPVHQALVQVVRAVNMPLAREVGPAAANPNPAYRAVPLLVTISPTWVEADRLVNPQQAVNELLQSAAVRKQKELSDTPRPTAVVVSEAAPAPSMPGMPPPPGGSGRVAVFGSSLIVADDVARRARTSPVGFDMVAAAIDWLRDRPPLATGIESKKYEVYQFPAPDALDTTRLLFFPLGLTVLIVAGLGTALWVVRRR
jgi:hypothetical protein